MAAVFQKKNVVVIVDYKLTMTKQLCAIVAKQASKLLDVLTGMLHANYQKRFLHSAQSL